MNRAALLCSFRLGLKQAAAEPLALIGPMVVLTALTLSYGAMLKAVPQADLDRLGLTHDQLVWYVSLTEAVAMIDFYYFRYVQRDLETGVLDLWLLRPVRFWPVMLAGWVGRELPRAALMLLGGLTLGLAVSGHWLLPAPRLLMFVASVAVSMMMILCACMVIGCAAAWMRDARPLFWLCHKLLFLFGALLWPMALYPVWMQKVAWATPFPAILATPGSFALAPPLSVVAIHAGIQLFWLAVLVAACTLMESGVRRRISRVGG